jgi:carbon starvation protein
MNKNLKIILWIAVALIGAYALAGIALSRGESINALWIIAAAACVYAIGYRFYAAWIAAKVLVVDPTRVTLFLPINGLCLVTTLLRLPALGR